MKLDIYLDAQRYMMGSTMKTPTKEELLEALDKAIRDNGLQRISDATNGSYVELMSSIYNDAFVYTASPDDLDRLSSDFMDPTKSVKTCQHEWAQYTGLKESFSYCKKCDVKA